MVLISIYISRKNQHFLSDQLVDLLLLQTYPISTPIKQVTIGVSIPEEILMVDPARQRLASPLSHLQHELKVLRVLVGDEEGIVEKWHVLMGLGVVEVGTVGGTHTYSAASCPFWPLFLMIPQKFKLVFLLGNAGKAVIEYELCFLFESL